ncbi:tRNA epoxyqueuosine(34) reductase QueG [Francisellaceae bacterium]|nr:tRNA epoxyqueuosine(34) reductase QueG [Francisellaceae bacterium]
MQFSLREIESIKSYASSINISQLSFSDTDLSEYIPAYKKWIDKNYHGSMSYMTKHGNKRLIPEQLIPNTKSVIVITYNYFNEGYKYKNIKSKLTEASKNGIISQYAVGRDYHKVVKKKLSKIVKYIETMKPNFQSRIFTDSAPVLEKPLAEKAGIGYIGKNSMLISPEHGSFFFLGVIFTNQLLPENYHPHRTPDLCKGCTACIKICPTGAIDHNKMIDARKCISYLTIENKGPIPIEYRKAIGTRIYGCDDCQLICPWNKHSNITDDDDFFRRTIFKESNLIDLFQWSEDDFLKHTEGSAIRRIGHTNWIRNIAIALGNLPPSDKILGILKIKLTQINNDLLREHILWAINNHETNIA